MSLILSFESPLEFLLRCSVLLGMAIAIVGTATCMLAKRITMAKRNTDEINKNDRFYVGLMLFGLSLILIGIVVIALPIEATFYVGG